MNPLFPNFERELQEAARREFQATELGKLLANGGPKELRQVKKLADMVKRYARGGAATKYGRLTESLKGMIVREMLKYVPGGGKLAGLLQAMMRPAGEMLADSLDKELKAAANMLQAFGYGVTPPRKVEHAPGVPVQQQGAGPQNRQGGGVAPWNPIPRPEPVADGPNVVPPISSKPFTSTSRQDNTVTVSVSGQKYRLDPNDPMLTGQMIPVSSSNVHSIGFLWNRENPRDGTLKVRFLNRAKSGGGPLYHYYGVNPAVFQSFKLAASKGKFVWDRLRVRGTVSGHQFKYDLAGIDSSGYVPRKATRYGQNEYFLRRQVQAKGSGKRYQSELQDEFVQRVGNFRPPPGVIAGRGAPNRGTPNRGRP